MKRILVLTLIILLCTQLLHAQNQVIVNLVVTPPYSTQLSDYTSTPNKLLVTLNNTSRANLQVYLTATISGDNGINISTTHDTKPAQALTLMPLSAFNLTVNNLQDLFNVNNLIYEGISKEEVLQMGGLPEGTYTICIRVWDYNTGAPLSNEEPSGCCAPFMITNVEPPVITSPFSGDSITAQAIQNVVFSWTFPPGAPTNLLYDFRIVEVLPEGHNPDDAMASSHPFYETTVNQPVLLYGPSMPPLVAGKTYAVQVTAIDPTGRTAFRNGGRSEVVWFIYKQGTNPIGFTQKTPQPTKTEISEISLEIFVPYCSGNSGEDLKYTNLVSSKFNTIPPDAIAVNNVRNFYLRWEDKGNVLASLAENPQEYESGLQGTGILYLLEISDTQNNEIVWSKEVWQLPSYEEGMNTLPFVDGQRYTLHITAIEAEKTGETILKKTDNKGNPTVIAESGYCDFTYMVLDDVPDLEQYTVKGKLLYKFQEHPEKFPLNSKLIKLTRYTTTIDTASKSIVSASIPTAQDERHSIPVQINEDGTFEVVFMARSNGGYVETTTDYVPSGMGSYSARVVNSFEFFKLETNSPYYDIPETRIELSNNEINLGEITANVFDYTLEVEISKGYKTSMQGDFIGDYRELTPKNITGEIIRYGYDNIYDEIPYYEGEIEAGSEKVGKYSIKNVTSGKVVQKTGTDGKMHTVIVFDKLICNALEQDKYSITIRQDTVINGQKKSYLCGEFWLTPFQFKPSDQQVMEYFQQHSELPHHFVVKRKGTIISDAPPTSTVKGQLVYRDPSNPESNIKPLPYTEVALMVTYLIEDENGHQTVMDIPHLEKEDEINDAIVVQNFGNKEDIENSLNKLSDRNRILATTTTDENGNFEFKDFANIDSLGSQTVNEFSLSGAIEFRDYFEMNGKLTRTVRLVVNNNKRHYWLNPNNNILVQPNSSVDVGTLTAYMDTYKMYVRPIGDPNNTSIQYRNKTLKGVKVEVNKLKYPAPQWLSQDEIHKTKYVNNDEGTVFSIPKHFTNELLPGNIYNESNLDGLQSEVKITVTPSDTIGEHSYQESRISFPRQYYKQELDWHEEEHTDLNDINLYQIPCPDIFNTYPEEYRYVSDYEEISCEVKIRMFPNDPIVSGRILDYTNTMRAVNAKVTLCKCNSLTDCNIIHPQEYQFTSEDNNHGYFSFQDLVPSTEKYLLQVHALGYTLAGGKKLESNGDTSNVASNSLGHIPGNGGITLNMGQQIHFPQILMKPNGMIKGFVVNEDGTPVKSFVRTSRSKLLKTKSRYEYTTPMTCELMSERIEVPAPTFHNDTLFIIPEDLTYFNDTVLIPPFFTSEYDVGTIEVKERRHRMRILVKRPGYSIAGSNGIAGVTVKILDYESITGPSGYADFEFKNASMKNFWYEVIPPEGSDYIAVTGELTNEESKNTQYYTITLTRGASVSGIVTSENTPVPNAEVWVRNGKSIRKTLTDEQGQYTLHGIKINHYLSYVNGQKIVEKGAIVKCNGPQNSTDFSNLIGSEKKVTFDSAEGSATANFDLLPFEDANIETLFGFKINVTKLETTAPGKFKISGIVDLTKNVLGHFKLIQTTDQAPAFTNLLVEPDPNANDIKGRPYLRLQNDQQAFSMNKTSLKAQFKGTPENAQAYNYNILLENDNNFLQIQRNNATSGFIRSKARIVDNSFNFPGSYFNFPDDQFYISEAEGAQPTGTITSFVSQILSIPKVNQSIIPNGGSGVTTTGSQTFYSQQNPIPIMQSIQNIQVVSQNSFLGNLSNAEAEFETKNAYLLHDINRKPLEFHFLEFAASSPTTNSYLTTNGSIYLKPLAWTLNPLLKEQGIIDTIKMDLPYIKITSEGVNTDDQLMSKINIKFEEWDIEARNCEVNPQVGGIHSGNAVIKTGSLDIPVKDFTLRHDLIFIDKPELQNLPLGGGIATMQMQSGVTPQFGLDPKIGTDQKPHFKLCFVGEPAAIVEGLPGLDPIKFQAVSLLSNGEQIISFSPDCETVRYHNLVDFQPLAIYSYADEFVLDGNIMYGIPRVPDMTYKMSFKKKSGKLTDELYTSNIVFTGPGNVVYKSLLERLDKQIITDEKVQLFGTVEEPGQLDPIRVVLTKRRAGTGYDIQINRDTDSPEQTLKLGEKSDSKAPEFIVDRANMKVENNDWDLLHLKLFPKADFASNSGFGGEPLYFVVHGEIQTDDSEDKGIKVAGLKDSDTGFGDFTFYFDYPNKQFIGTMTIANKNMGGVIFGGQAEMAVGAQGFYFVGSGKGNMSPYGGITAGFLIGHYNVQLPQYVMEIATRYSIKKEYPCSFNAAPFSGIYVTGRIILPIVNLNYEKNISGVATFKLLTEVGGEASAWAVFTGGSSQIGISAMLYAHAELVLQSITCTSINANLDASVKGITEINLNTSNTANLSLCADLAVSGCIKQKVPALVGCVGPELSFGASAEFHAGISASIDLNDPFAAPSFNYSLGLGSCSTPGQCSSDVNSTDPCDN
ncbi:MAG: hypothetical protein CSA36_05440 [Draconibacterium sp.]|nr:MAG: hypothetical protein CSA36_05440 [Draconibacterium sp.]